MTKLITIAVLLTTTSLWASTYKLDPAHNNIGFSVKQLMISNVRGNFAKTEASLDFDKAKSEVKNVKVDIDVASVNTGIQKRDDHLRSPDFFDVAKFPKMTFVADKAVKVTKDKETQLHGTLTIKGVSKPVVLNTTFLGETKMGDTEKVGFTAHTKISRKDFGMTWNKALEAGGVAVGDEISIEIEGEADQAK